MSNTRLNAIQQANATFLQQITPDNLPKRGPETLAVITCMDPRINLAALGIEPFLPDGSGQSNVRIIRTLGGMADARSLIVGVYLAGFTEIVVLMHTNCGCCLAHDKAGVIAHRMEARLDSAEFQTLKTNLGEPFESTLQTYLKTFDNPRTAVAREVAAIKTQPYMPTDVAVHGLLYDTASGAVEVIVNGYDATG